MGRCLQTSSLLPLTSQVHPDGEMATETSSDPETENKLIPPCPSLVSPPPPSLSLSLSAAVSISATRTGEAEFGGLAMECCPLDSNTCEVDNSGEGEEEKDGEGRWRLHRKKEKHFLKV